MKKISIFLICSLLMIFGLSFSACADAVTTGGVTAVVTPRPVDSLGNEKQVEFATSAKAETTTTETTTKPAYNQEEMKKDLEELGKEDMAASTIGIFAWVKGLVDWTQGIINALGAAIKAGINSPWGFDLKGFVCLKMHRNMLPLSFRHRSKKVKSISAKGSAVNIYLSLSNVVLLKNM